MRKIIEEILVPKPAAHPRIYAYAIAEQPPLPACGHPLLHSEWRRGLGRGGAPVSPLPARALQGEGVGSRRSVPMSQTTGLHSLSSIRNGGEGWGEEAFYYQATPLPDPLPTPASRGEGIKRSASRLEMIRAAFIIFA